jgi:hypothetical protein
VGFGAVGADGGAISRHPLDVVPDFIPIPGQLGDAIIVASVLLGAGDKPVREHRPGPSSSLRLILGLRDGRRDEHRLTHLQKMVPVARTRRATKSRADRCHGAASKIADRF